MGTVHPAATSGKGRVAVEECARAPKQHCWQSFVRFKLPRNSPGAERGLMAPVQAGGGVRLFDHKREML